MIHVLDGDLLANECNVIAHQCNCQKTMDAGIARTIAKLYPEAYQIDQKLSLSSKKRLGKCSYAFSENNDILVFNLYGQEFYGGGVRNTDYIALESAFEMMLLKIQEFESNAKNINIDFYNEYSKPDFLEKYNSIIKLGIPYLMGCDLAGGDWNVVYSLVERLSNKYNRDLYIYRLDKNKNKKKKLY